MKVLAWIGFGLEGSLEWFSYRWWLDKNLEMGKRDEQTSEKLRKVPEKVTPPYSVVHLKELGGEWLSITLSPGEVI